MTINKEQGLFKPSQCCRGTFYLKQAICFECFQDWAFLCCLKNYKCQTGKKQLIKTGTSMGRRPTITTILECQNWAVNQSKNCWQLRRPKEGTELPEQSSRGCVHQEAKKPLVLGQRALEQETPVLWLHTWHDQSDPVTDERPLTCTYRTSCASQTYKCLVPTAAELLTS